jgi:hypothetical protein
MAESREVILTKSAIVGAIHHAWLQTLNANDLAYSIIMTRGLARLQLRRKYGISVYKIKARAQAEIDSGRYEEALKRLEESSRGTQTIVGEVERLVEKLDKLLLRG